MADFRRRGKGLASAPEQVRPGGDDMERQVMYRVVDLDTMVILDCYTEAGKDAYMNMIKMVKHEPYLIDFTVKDVVAA